MTTPTRGGAMLKSVRISVTAVSEFDAKFDSASIRSLRLWFIVSNWVFVVRSKLFHCFL